MGIGIGDIIIDIWPFAIVGLIVLLFVLWKRKFSFSYILCFLVFSIYLLYALQETLFPIFISGELAIPRGQTPFMLGVNLIPFYFGRSLDSENIVLGILQNIILTIPLGFGLSFVWRTSKKKIISGVIIGGLGFETAQLIISLALGHPYRVIDVNDVLCNVTGALIGYCIFRAFAWLYLLATHKFNIVHKGLSAYIYAVSSQAQITNKTQNA